MNVEKRLAGYYQLAFSYSLNERCVLRPVRKLSFEGIFRGKYIQILKPVMYVVHARWYESTAWLNDHLRRSVHAATDARHVVSFKSEQRKLSDQWYGMLLPVDAASLSRILPDEP